MSRIGRLPITVPSGVTVSIDSNEITVTGPLGTLKQFTMPGINVALIENEIIVTRDSEAREHKAKHGLMRSLINNMIIGVTAGFKKQLEINGVGFRANIEGNKLKMSLGFSHEVIYQIPDSVKISIEQNIITVSGISNQQVGQVAAEIRSFKKPEPYKGKGIKYTDERIIRKSGKTGKEK